ncbi:hypothetical protein PUR29_36730 [Methylobacterium ajmalii]|uniref:Uncharacterized protein n=1 Tax=Methylobacterium ajmalii TaxID=2738439 RepID=A0ABV0A810_9HYPH
MILIIYHAEELKRDVIHGVAAQKRWHDLLHDIVTPKVDDTDNPAKKQKRAFDFLIADGVLTPQERNQMVALIGRRNGIAHHLDQVMADLETGCSVRDWVDYMPNRQTHDYEALDQLRAARKLLSDRMASRQYVLELNFRKFFFETTEKILSKDIMALERRISKLVCHRAKEIARLNGEFSLTETDLTGIFDPCWPENRYGRGRLTPRGVEICYRLFDLGKSAMAVAHLMNLSLAASRRRERMWRALGGAGREKRVLMRPPRPRSEKQRY